MALFKLRDVKDRVNPIDEFDTIELERLPAKGSTLRWEGQEYVVCYCIEDPNCRSPHIWMAKTEQLSHV